MEQIDTPRGSYQIEATLGEGSMAITSLAREVGSGRAVAIKRFFPSRLASLKDLELFMREAALLARLDHPLIPRYLEAATLDDGEAASYVLVQAYVPGETLREALGRGHRFHVREVLELGVRLLEVLRYLHEREPAVIHRDLKPENIILGEDGAPHLVDFGAVREVVRLTMRGGSTIVGTFGYMAPEQLMGQARPATDLYALGVVLLECLTRQVPADLHGEDAARLIDGLSADEGVKQVLRRLCAPRLDARYADTALALEDLRAVIAGRAPPRAAALDALVLSRDHAAAQALAERARPRMHWGYVVTLSMITAAGVAAVAVLALLLLSAQLGPGVVLAMTLSALGVLTNLSLLTLRYVHDTWEGPAPGWVRTTGRLRGSRREVDEMTGRSVWHLEYEFPVRGGTHIGTVECPSRSVAARHLPGETFSVFYPPGKPHQCEIEDFITPST